jgi:hypothetical protein
VDDVELRRIAVGQTLKAEEKNFFRQAAVDAPVEIPAHIKWLPANLVGRRAGNAKNEYKENDDSAHDYFSVDTLVKR